CPHHTPLPPLFPYTTLFRSVGTSALVLFARVFAGAAPAGTFTTGLLAGLGVGFAEGHRDLLVGLGALQRVEHVLWGRDLPAVHLDRKSTRLNSSHVKISYAV